MKRQFKRYPCIEGFAEKLVEWIDQQPNGICLRGEGWCQHFNESYEAIAGVGVRESYTSSLLNAATFIESNQDYVFVHLNYDVKNELHGLDSRHSERVSFPQWRIFIPNWIIKVQENHIEIGWMDDTHSSAEADLLIQQISNQKENHQHAVGQKRTQSTWSKEAYLTALKKTLAHIQAGDIYQANICQEFYWEDVALHSAQVFNQGFRTNPNPFSAFYKLDGMHCLCWSPERFLTFNGRKIISQPMKGTSPRGNTEAEDRMNFQSLQRSEKDRRENVMIVDMVRNDLSHFAEKNSVEVSELYKVVTYPKVHQMHSTVTADLKRDVPFFDALLKAFPMGSMTGAPKRRAMEIIEQIEATKRGLFSGTIGLITPDGNADFNVVIRSLLYNESTKSLSCMVGGGITAQSNIEDEFEESLVKFEPIRQLIESLEVQST
jgi:para-aminobenzoate synthetase component I